MYKIPHDLNLLEFNNEAINQISFGLNVVILFFDKGIIQFSGHFSIHSEQDTHKYEEIYPIKNDMGLLQLLEKKIMDTRTNEERTSLIIELEDNITLELTSNEMYESFEITIDDRRIIV